MTTLAPSPEEPCTCVQDCLVINGQLINAWWTYDPDCVFHAGDIADEEAS